MPTITTLRKQINEAFSACLEEHGFEFQHLPTWHLPNPGAIKVVHIAFLDRIRAAYFHSNSASFVINVGVYFKKDPDEILFPEEYACHMRGNIVTDFRQNAPLRNVSQSHPENRRRDIWWVEKDGSNIDFIIQNGVRLLQSAGLDWLEKYADAKVALQVLRQEKEKDTWEGGPYGFGAMSSPMRKQLIERLEEREGADWG